MNFQAIKLNLHECSTKANANFSNLCMLPKRKGLLFMGWDASLHSRTRFQEVIITAVTGKQLQAR